MRNLTLFPLLMITACVTLPAEAATRQTFNDGMLTLSGKILKALKDNPLVEGQRPRMGEFVGEGVADASNFGQRIKTQLSAELKDQMGKESPLTLAGTYHFVAPETEAFRKEFPRAKVLLIAVVLKSERGKELLRFEEEVNDSDDIRQVLGLTGAGGKPTDKFAQNNEQIQRDVVKPTFDIVDQARVAATNARQWSMGILKKSSFNGSTTAVAPQNVAGQAFVPIGVGEYYEIELANNDIADAVATLTVDGLDVANTFSEDKEFSGKKIHWPGYYVPKGSRVVIRGWLHTIDQQVQDNVFAFGVVELGQGAASQLKGRGGVGVITVQFREACAPGERLSGRSVGETAKKEGLKEKLEAKPAIIGDNVLSTISIRYNRPE